MPAPGIPYTHGLLLLLLLLLYKHGSTLLASLDSAATFAHCGFSVTCCHLHEPCQLLSASGESAKQWPTLPKPIRAGSSPGGCSKWKPTWSGRAEVLPIKTYESLASSPRDSAGWLQWATLAWGGGNQGGRKSTLAPTEQ